MGSEPPSLAGRVAIVTGASSGLGRRFSKVLGDAGARVVAAARRVDKLEELAAEQPGIVPHYCDLTDEQSLQEMVDHCISQFGRIDILVNNAGMSVQEPSETASSFQQVVDLNLCSQFRLTQLVAQHMLRAETGSIVNVASILGLVASSPIQQAAYCAAKGGLISLTRQLAVEWAARGIRVNALAPGWFESELTEELFASERGRRWLTRNTPLARGGAIDELDGAMLLLASPAGSFITGQTLTVDGGWTAR